MPYVFAYFAERDAGRPRNRPLAGATWSQDTARTKTEMAGCLEVDVETCGFSVQHKESRENLPARMRSAGKQLGRAKGKEPFSGPRPSSVCFLVLEQLVEPG